MYHLQFLNFDSNLTTTSNPLDSSFILSDPLRRIKRIYLKSVELPINFNNIRNNFNTIEFTFKGTTTATTSYILTIPSAYYTNISDILTVLNNQIKYHIFQTFTTDQFPQFSLNSNNTITCSVPVPGLTFSLTPSNVVSQILGFTNANNLIFTTSITSSRIFNLNYDNYLNIYFPNIPHKTNGFSNQLMSFKIPLNATNGSIYYTAENISFSQFIEITDENFILNNLKIQVYDQFNNLLNNNGINWSFTLAFQY